MKDKIMQNTLFTDNFPLVSTDQELQQVIKKYPDYDPYYIVSGCIKERRDKFDQLWSIFKPLADENFLSDLKKHFHQRTWEMYLGGILKKKFDNVSSYNTGPDFVIDEGKENEIFIEAVACEKGTTEDAVPEMFVAEKPEEIRALEVPHDEMLLRLTNSLDKKYKKYKNFIENKKKPYIIAVNRGELEYLDPQIPLILKCLFSFGYEHFKIKKVDNHLVYTYAGWTRRDYIEKKDGEKVPMKFFEEEYHNIISAVIYSTETVLNHPEVIGPNCIIAHNPKAKFPIDLDTFSFLQQQKAEYKESGLEIKEIEP